MWSLEKHQSQKQAVFVKNCSEKLFEIWNKIDIDVARNLQKNYTNCLLLVLKD